MKLIMENWRGYISEQQVWDAMLYETFHRYQKKELEESLFRNLVAGLGLAVGTMFLALQAEREGNIQQAVAQMQINKEELKSDEEKQVQLKKLLMNPTAWQWNPDPYAGIGYPKTKKGEEWFTVMPPDWSIALQVLQDKEKGIVNVPGLPPGELPSPQEIYDVLTDDHSGDVDLENYIKQLKPYMTYTTTLGSDLSAVGKQMSPPTGPEMDTYLMSTIAVDPEYFQSHSDFLMVQDLTARHLYIKYYFGKYLGADEAIKYGIEMGKSEGNE